MLDLHIHSTYSDGLLSPRQIVAEAKRKHLYGLALTDHDCVSGLEEMKELCLVHDLFFLPGVEFSLEVEGHDIHLLFYGVDEKDDDILALTQEIRQDKINRMKKILERFAEDGLFIPEDDFWQLAGDNPNRFHLAQICLQQGLVASIGEAFQKYLGRGKKYFVAKRIIPYKRYLELARKKGYQTFIAHPKTVKNDDLVRKLLEEGVDGLEVVNEKHSLIDTMHYREMAQAMNKRISGGSDCHGRRIKGNYLLGNYKITKDYFMEEVL